MEFLEKKNVKSGEMETVEGWFDLELVVTINLMLERLLKNFLNAKNLID